MYLKSLVLKGFKSFADRSVLALEPGIIAVVGPNGSGKSNISDAVLWVLGERNAKHLRGQAMEDVIFAGSSARKSVGIAEVDLVLDNSDGTLPVDFDEVAVTRRMYRSGESEYLINGVVARRMDVLDILHDSGLGTGTHSIISQGSLDSILQSKPEDRRALIEEAAGVLKHKQRKAKSERKLAAMDAHLARVKDVAAEVERQLGPLERKAKRARTYQGLADELADLSLSLAVDDLRTLRRGWDDALARERALEAELEEKRAAIAQAEAAAEELQEKIRRESVDAGELARRHRRASSAVERFDGATLLLHEKRRAAQSYEAELRVTLEANAAKRAQAEADRAQAVEQLAELRGKTDSARAEARRAEEKLAAVRREFEDIERQRGEAERTVAQARPSVEALEQKLAALKQELESAAARYEEAQEAVVPLRKEAARLRDALSEAKLKAATLSERQTYTSRVVDARTRDLEAVASSDAEARESLVKKQVAQRRIEPLLALFEELVASARRWTRDLEEAATAAQDSSTGLHNAVNEARARARAAHDAFDDANARLSAARVDKGRLEVQVDAAVNAIVHDCKVPLDRALETPELEDRGATEDAAFKLRRRIANMGTINPDAAEEYEQLKTRYDYLAAQLSDLDGARRSLAKIVRVIDARMKDDFVRTFEAVNKNFSEIFAVLFPGGSAELTLVDPDDLENTGVEVTAQPRGKRITKMMLMSGGEKSLTALALLFAVYRIRTTPFYILDEVEAALDDSNLRRLTSYLESLRDTTQLIMITHQRRTMEMADMLFGVSMQADGVTKVVSQKLENALRHAE